MNTLWPVIEPTDRRILVSADEKRTSTYARVTSAFADMKSGPESAAGMDAQVINGECVRVLDQTDGWVKIVTQLCDGNGGLSDHYVGWVERRNLGEHLPEPTHRVCVPRTFVYGDADMKKRRTGYRSMASLLAVKGETETRGTRYAILESGEAVVANHIVPKDEWNADYVAVAEKLLHTPYLWGGNTGFGLDCSGLVQLSMRMAGRDVFRDTDMQAASIGEPVEVGEDWQDLERGDLVFWRGHVAICQGLIDGVAHIIHANGNTMDVASEPVTTAVDRIAHLYERPIGVRRP